MADIQQFLGQRGLFGIRQKIRIVIDQVFFHFKDIPLGGIGNTGEALRRRIQEIFHAAHIGIRRVINVTQRIFFGGIDGFSHTPCEGSPVGIVFHHNEVIFHTTGQVRDIVILHGFRRCEYIEDTHAGFFTDGSCQIVQRLQLPICQISAFINHKINRLGFRGNGKGKTKAKHQSKERGNDFSIHNSHLLTASRTGSLRQTLPQLPRRSRPAAISRTCPYPWADHRRFFRSGR